MQRVRLRGATSARRIAVACFLTKQLCCYEETDFYDESRGDDFEDITIYRHGPTVVRTTDFAALALSCLTADPLLQKFAIYQDAVGLQGALFELLSGQLTLFEYDIDTLLR